MVEMRGSLVFMLATAGCGSGPNAGSDAAIDATGCQPKMLLVGGTDVAPQGWSIVMQLPASLTYAQDYVRLQTSTTSGASKSGQLLLDYPGAFDPGKPFKLQIVMLVESVDPHNQFDSAAAIMASFTPPFGVDNDRSQMVFLDSGAVGWADDSPSFPSFSVSITNNAYHTYELSVDAANVARLSVDGGQALMRTGFVSNGALAIGDQTNEPNVDSALRIRSVMKLCP